MVLVAFGFLLEFDIVSFALFSGAGAYSLYRMNGNNQYCSPGTNMSSATFFPLLRIRYNAFDVLVRLPSDIQLAVCNSGIHLDNFLYELFWSTGDWSVIVS
jgi:hypothetical protein